MTRLAYIYLQYDLVFYLFLAGQQAAARDSTGEEGGSKENLRRRAAATSKHGLSLSVGKI